MLFAPSFDQDVGETLDYMVDWTTELSGDIIQTSTWDLGRVTGLTSSRQVDAFPKTTLYITASQSGNYRVTNLITTFAGRQEKQEFQIRVAAPSFQP